MPRLRFQHVCVIAGVVLLLTFLFVKTRAIDFEEHNRFSHDLRELRQSDATLNENLLKARYGLLTSYDQLIAETDVIEKIQADLQKIPSFVDAPAREEIRRELAAYALLHQEKEAYLERFKSQNAIINNSLRYFPIAASALTKNVPASENGREFIFQSNNLLRDVLLYYLVDDKELSPKIDAQIVALLQAREREPSSIEEANLRVAVSHAKTILRLKPEIDSLVRELVSIPTAGKTEDLLKLYNSQYERSLRSSNNYRLCLIAFSILLLGYIGFIIAKLKRATLALNVVNESLEQRVEERTAELSWSNRELQKSEANNRALLQAIPDSMWRTDSDGVFLDVRAAKGEEASIPASHWFGKSINEVLPPEIAAQLLSNMKRTLETGNTQVFEYKLNDGGGPNHYEARISLSGEAEILTVVRNMTEQKRLEEQLRQAQKLESIGQLAAGIAHEINTPTQYVGDNTRFLLDSFQDLFTVLDKQTQALASGADDAATSALIKTMKAIADDADLEYLVAEIPKAIGQSLEGVERISKIVQSMKDFAHPGGMEKRTVDLNKAIESTITVASNEWKYLAEMETDFDKHLPPVPCLLGEFNQVILNMIVNAAHAIGEVIGDGSRGKGKIRISTRSDEEWVEVRVGDTGTGIPEALRTKIFDPFFTTKEVGKGTGQGLAISHTVIVERHGGTLSVESEMERGTTFIIRLPLPESASCEEQKMVA